MDSQRHAPSSAFTPHQQRLLRRLWANHGKPLSRVAEEFGSTREGVLAEMGDIFDIGLVELDDADCIQMVPPREALAELMVTQTRIMETTMARLNRMGSLVVALGEEGESRRNVAEADRDATTPVVDVEIVQGKPPSQVLMQWINEGHGTLRFLRPEQWRLPTEPVTAAAFREALASGVDVRAIYPVRALHLARSVLEEHRASGEDMRLLPEVPLQMAIVGTGHAMVVSGLGGDELHTVIIREPLIVRVLVAYFDSLWDQAASLPGGDEVGDRSEERRLLLTQLARGARDEQIARSLGLGLRTVRRRVADLMLELGVETRFQAGVEAVRRGWL
ncbi:DNA-binding response regulator [Nocardioides yefusunii]|uniref:DNA-binding response regulator n=1 Tax=Nocardioides yefusunii TaxID=2500546 RepID=A0ABW1QWL9_9ACTN|nr:DNA-binding response regulator [Nocardioides yefusunii]